MARYILGEVNVVFMLQLNDVAIIYGCVFSFDLITKGNVVEMILKKLKPRHPSSR